MWIKFTIQKEQDWGTFTKKEIREYEDIHISTSKSWKMLYIYDNWKDMQIFDWYSIEYIIFDKQDGT